MALRNAFDTARYDLVPPKSEPDRRRFAEIVATLEGGVAAGYLYQHLLTVSEPDENVARYVERVVRYLIPTYSREDNIARWARKRAVENPELEVRLLVALAGSSDSFIRKEVSDWTNEVVPRLLQVDPQYLVSWTAVPIEGLPHSESPWTVQPRTIAGETSPTPFFSSLPLGESRTGIYRSGPFDIPKKLSFWCAGHSGVLGRPITDNNWIRLCDAKTGKVVAQSQPPRNDAAQRIEWDLSKAATSGRGYLELVDGDTGAGWAWLAVGRFSLAALNPSDTARQQQLAAELVGKLKLASLKPQMVALVTSPKTELPVRAAAAQALVALRPDSRAAALALALAEPTLAADLRLKASQAIAEANDSQFQESLRDVMKLAPARLQTALADALAGDRAGAEALLTTIAAGAAAPRLLLAPGVKTKLDVLKSELLKARVAELTAKLPPANQALDKLIAERRNAYPKVAVNLERGQAVYTKHCAACHQLAGQGAVVGPQLDGIGNRGLDRLLEDLLDPSRNVDVAFRTTTLRLADGRVASGLVRREEGTQLVLADNQGKEFTVAKSQIDEQQKTLLSLMPANVGEIVPESEFFDLIGWLLSKHSRPPTPSGPAPP
jgi:putative heme-binding domain-containing protein